MSRMVVGMTMNTTAPSRQPIAKPTSTHDRKRRETEMKQELVCLLVGGLTVVPRDRDVDVLRQRGAL